MYVSATPSSAVAGGGSWMMSDNKCHVADIRICTERSVRATTYQVRQWRHTDETLDQEQRNTS
jgi:hypothetical protein